MHKTKFLILLVTLSLSLTACSGGGGGSSLNSSITTDNYSGNSDSYDSYDEDTKGFDINSTADDSTTDYEDNYDAEQSTESLDVDNSTSTRSNETTTKTDIKNNEKNMAEKLVYSGSVSIESLEFNDSVKKFKQLLNANNGFVEYENFSDNNESYDWYIRDDDVRHNTYSARVRIPSSNFNTIMEGVADLGSVKSKNSNVQNFTQEYSDTSISIDILNKTYQQYSELLKDAHDTDTIIMLTDKLSEIQRQIEIAKSRLRSIDNDVAYSYLDINIKEVTKYTEDPPKKDTFIQRLTNTFKDSLKGFGEFIEDTLFGLIMLAPYIILIVIIVIIVRLIMKKHNFSIKKKRKDPSKDLNNQFNSFANAPINTEQVVNTQSTNNSSVEDNTKNDTENK